MTTRRLVGLLAPGVALTAVFAIMLTSPMPSTAWLALPGPALLALGIPAAIWERMRTGRPLPLAASLAVSITGIISTCCFLVAGLTREHVGPLIVCLTLAFLAPACAILFEQRPGAGVAAAPRQSVGRPR